LRYQGKADRVKRAGKLAGASLAVIISFFAGLVVGLLI
jgi:hypothetical protein